MILCQYGCGREAKYQFKNGKWCCENNIAKCPHYRKILSEKLKGKVKSESHKKNLSDSKKGSTPWNKGKVGVQTPWNKGKRGLQVAWNKGKIGIFSEESLKKISKSNKGRIPWSKGKKGIHSEETIKQMSIKQKRTIKYLKRKYPFFCKIEEMRYNPDKPGEKEIQVHCKNHNCPNSKEQGGWFTPSNIQLYERIRQLEKDYGNGGCYFYCCDECKNECPLYYLKSDPLKNDKVHYTSSEYKQFREFVLERDKYICQYCGKKAEHVHHERPQKLEPFFALDPDLAWSVCKECHYKYGHKDECSTGKIATTICI